MGITDSVRPFRAFSGAGRYVCVSYAHKDSGPVYDILERLYTDGYNIWYDEGRPSSDTTELQARMAVSGCEVFVVFISPSSVRGGSDTMRMLEQVRKLKKPIIYATIDCFRMPDGMESYFQGNRMITGDENEVAESLRGAIPTACRGAARRDPARFTLDDDTFAGGDRPESTADIDDIIDRISTGGSLNIVTASPVPAAQVPLGQVTGAAAAGAGPAAPSADIQSDDGSPYSEPVIIREEFYENRDKPLVIGGGPAEDETEPVIIREDLSDEDGEDGISGNNSRKAAKKKEQPEDDRFRFVFSGDSGLTLTEYTGNDTDLVIEELRDGYPITGIGDQVFRECGQLLSIRLPASVTLIGHTAFRDCKKLSEVFLPTNLTALGAGAFYGCVSLRKLTIPDSVTAIGDMAFRGCTSLSRLTIPDSVRAISDDAFRDCMLLIIECTENSYPHWFATHNNIPFRVISDAAMTARLQPLYGNKPHQYASSVNVYGAAAQDLSAVRKSARLIVADENEYLDTSAKKYSPVIEPLGDRYAYLCFSDEDYNELRELIDDMLAYGFDLCRSPDPKDGESARTLLKEQIKKCRSFVFFLSEKALQSDRVMDAELDLAVKYVSGRMTLIRLDGSGIPDVLSHVPGGSVINRMLLSRDELKTALAGHLASSGCGSDSGVQKGSARLTAGDFEFTVRNSGAVITRYSGNKTKLEIPSKLGGYGVTALGNRVFDGNTVITEVSIPPTVTDLGVELFKGCRKLRRVLLPSALTKIGYGTFRDCESLKELNLPSTITEIGWHAFAGCRSLSAMAIPIRVAKIENWAFDGCISLGKISIPDHVTKIDVNAFFNCSKRLTILSTKGSYAQKFAMQNGYKWKRVR